MVRTILFASTMATAAAFAAATVVFAGDAGISKVKVAAELEDIETANALQFWPDIEDDLEKVITAWTADRMEDTGYEVSVRVTEISLSGSKLLQGTGEFNHMEGWAFYRRPGELSPVDQRKVIVDAETAAPMLMEGETLVLPDVPDFYLGVLAGFANGVEGGLDELADLE